MADDNDNRPDTEPMTDGRHRDRFGDPIDGGGPVQPGRQGATSGHSLGMMLIAQTLANTAFLLFLLPQFNDVFAGMKLDLPYGTRLLLMTSNLVVKWWFISVPTIIGVCALIVGLAGNPRTGSERETLLIGANAAMSLLLICCVVAVFAPPPGTLHPIGP